jgi:uncharacterized protein YqjF (DUF2071 family)
MLSADVDRIAPTRRPGGKVVGYQNWRALAFLHWAVPVADLRRVVPSPFALDLYEGMGLVGIVPFVMRDVRPSWWPRVLAFNFLETNLRTYVVCNNRPGVYFFSLEANSRLAVWAARSSFSLPYHHARMQMTESGGEVDYLTRRDGSAPSHHVRYRVGEPLGPSRPGTLEHFLLERYLLFVQRREQLLAGQVYHSPYPAHTLHVAEVQDELVAAAGLPAVSAPPLFAHYSPGVDVEVFPLRNAVTPELTQHGKS